MNAFAYTRASDADGALRLAGQPGGKFLAGGTNLLDLMKAGVEAPVHLVDISRLPLAEISDRGGGVRLGAMARNAETARHPLVRERFPLVAQAILSGASPQLRNMATNGGNLLQRTRCYYFYDPALPCNKRAPGTGCGALEGFNRIHAILGASAECIATHPSDFCVALAALEAIVRLRSAQGKRVLPIGDFHRLPGTTPERDTNLAPDELIASIDLPAGPYAAHSHYLKVRDRASYAFALVSVAAALELEGGRIRSARCALGGVAHKPWRSLEAEAALAGTAPIEESFTRAAEIALQGAEARRHNAFKPELARRAIVRAFTQAAAGTQAMDYYAT